MTDLIERVADAIDKAGVGYSIRLTKLIDGEAEYTATVNGQEPRIFPDHAEASEYVGEYHRKAKATAAIAIIGEAVRARLDEAMAIIRWIDESYERGDINHVDFRVQAKIKADAFLSGPDNG